MARRLSRIGTHTKLSSSLGSSGRFAARLRNAGSRLTRGTTIGLLLSTTRPTMPSPTRYLTACEGASRPSEASTWRSPLSRRSATSPRTVPWCFARISSARCSAERRFSVPDSAWLISSRVERRCDSRAWTRAGSGCRALAILPRAGADGFLIGDGHGPQERHQSPQPRADALDDVTAFLTAAGVEPRASGRVLLDPRPRELPAADLLEHLLHVLLRFARDET